MKVTSERLGHSQISVTADLNAHVGSTMGRASREDRRGVGGACRSTSCSRARNRFRTGQGGGGTSQAPAGVSASRGPGSSVSTECARRDSNPQPSDP